MTLIHLMKQIRLSLPKIPLSLALALLMGFAGWGCQREIEIIDGEIPDEYLSHAQQYVGDYHGEMEGVPSTLTLSLEGRKPIVSYRDASGGADLLHPACQSRIGQLLSVNLRGRDQDELSRVIFDFHPGLCTASVQGRRLLIDLREDDSRKVVFVSIFKERDWITRCDTIPHGGCERVPVNRYYQGRFER